MLRLERTSLRLSLQFAFLYCVLSAAIFVGAYWISHYEMRDWVLDQMVSDAEVLAEIFENEGLEGLSQSIDVMAAVNYETGRIFQLSGSDGSLLAGNITQIETSALSGYIDADEVTLTSTPDDGITGYWVAQHSIGDYALLQGTGNHFISELLEAMGISLVVGFILILALGTSVGVWVGRLTEKRIATISGTLKQVASGQLSTRIPTDSGSPDDLSRVTDSINNTLERLENLMESQVQISNDIAHDLRTPLQRLRQRLEMMADQESVNPSDAKAALTQTEDVISTFNALLRIAQVEAGDRREKFQVVDLGTLLAHVHEAFEPSAEDAGHDLQINIPEAAVRILGDPDLLMQLISNLVENALRHTPHGTTIRMDLATLGKGPVMSLSDNGPGIPLNEHEKILGRFYRGEKSRTTDGNGLGLSLCKAICDLHGAELAVLDNHPGLRIEARFHAAD